MSGMTTTAMNDPSHGSIVSLLPSATEIICALGLTERLAGVTHECDYPGAVRGLPKLTSSLISHETMSSREIDHAVRESLSGHGSIYALDELLLSEIDPSLVITQELCDVCAVSYDKVTEAARKYTACATVISLEPHTVDDILSNIVTVGETAGVKETALALVSGLTNRLSRLRSISARIGRKKRVMMLEWLEPPFAPGHWVPEQVELAGGIPVMGAAGKKSRATTYEQIAESKADVLVLIPCGYDIPDIKRQIALTSFPEVLSTLPAFESNEIWALDASAYFSRPGPRVVEGAEILAKVLNPSEFGEPSPDEAVRVDVSAFNLSTEENQ